MPEGSGEAEVQLIPKEPDSDTESVDLTAGDREGCLELQGNEESSEAGSPDRQSYGSRRKLASLCSSLRRTWFVKEFIRVFKLTLPLFLLDLFQQTPNFIVLLFVGQFYTATELTAVALGIAFYNVTGFSVLIGLSTAADTLCPQSYGYKNYKRVGVIFQRGLLILSLACLPIAALWLNTESILLFLKQQPCVVRLTGTYLRIFIVALPEVVQSKSQQVHMLDVAVVTAAIQPM